MLCASFAVAAAAAPAQSAGAAGSDANAAPAAPTYDVFANVLSDPQRKILDRDSRCHDARSATDTFVSSGGKELQTGVDAMVALEKCATLQRVGDWADFRDYVITAAAAVAYAVGTAASDDRLLHRAIDDASHVSGFDASVKDVSSYSATTDASAPGVNAGADSSDTGHRMGDGPPQSSEQYKRYTKRVAADKGTFGDFASKIAAAATARLASLPAKAQQR